MGRCCLRHTEDPTVWRVTILVVATCLPLADDAPSYPFDGSLQAVPHVLVVEFESAVEPGQRPSASWEYLEYIWEIFRRGEGIVELKSFMEGSSWRTRQDIALWMLDHNYSDAVAEVIALFEDNSAESWKRADAAKALRKESSPQVKQALDRATAQPGPQDVTQAATESLAYLNRRHQ